MDFVGWKILLQVANELPNALSTLSYRGGKRTIELAVKQELPVLRIEAYDIGGQHIDGEIRREPRNVFAVILRKLDSEIACHEVSTRTLPQLLTSAQGAFSGCQRTIVKLSGQRFWRWRFSMNWPPVPLLSHTGRAHYRARITWKALQMRSLA